jgi:outer membrane protein TolC
MKREMSLRAAGPSLLITLILSICSMVVRAQAQPPAQSPYTPPTSKRPIRSLPIKDTGVEEKLVMLALQNVAYDAFGRMIAIAQFKVKQQKNSWFDLLTLTSQFNDLTFKHQSTVGNVAFVYPKYFYGVTIPIGTILSKGSQVKSAREEVKIAEDNQIEAALKIRTDVLSKYRQWRTTNSLILLQRQVADDVHAAFLQVEKRFNDGAVSIETYGEASRSYALEMTKQLTYQLQAEMQKLDIEAIIGVRLESVIN